jgi:hypothetical protein
MARLVSSSLDSGPPLHSDPGGLEILAVRRMTLQLVGELGGWQRRAEPIALQFVADRRDCRSD